MRNLFVALGALLALGSAADAAPAQTSVAPHAPPPPHVRNEVRCTMIDGDPYSVSYEHGACDAGETEAGGGGYDGTPLETGSAAYRQCNIQEQRRLAQCNSLKGGAQSSCVSITMTNFALCEQNLPQGSSPVY
jgi:hypothetical protein